MGDYLVSIITPSYNCEEFIEEAIKSVIAQTYSHWEMLIVDDCSTDGSVAIINKYCNIDKRIKLILLNENSGACYARNVGIKNAKGRFIAFLDSDDLWLKHKLSSQLDYFNNHDVALIGSGYKVVNENGEFLYNIKGDCRISFFKMLFNNYLGCLTVIYDSTKIGKRFFPLLKRQEDWALWLGILRKIKYARRTSDINAVYRKRKSSMTSNKFKLILHNWKVYKEFLGYSTLHSLGVYFIFFCVYGCKIILYYYRYIHSHD